MRAEKKKRKFRRIFVNSSGVYGEICQVSTWCPLCVTLGESWIFLHRDSPWKPRHNTSWHGCQNVIEATWWLPLENPAGGQFQQNQGDEKWSSLERRFQGRDASLFAMKSSIFSDILGLGHTSGRWSTFILQCYFQTSEQENLVILDIHWRYVQNILCNLQMK